MLTESVGPSLVTGESRGCEAPCHGQRHIEGPKLEMLLILNVPTISRGTNFQQRPRSPHVAEHRVLLYGSRTRRARCALTDSIAPELWSVEEEYL